MSQYPYLTLNEYYRERFGKKIAKIALDAGFTCPNRDGTLGTEGCIFCSAYGSGDYAQSRTLSISDQIKKGKEMIGNKWKDVSYIAYFQAFTNTYAPVDVLEQNYNEALAEDDVVGISIATRPDCLGEDVLDLLERIHQKTALFVELGFQTANEESAKFIERGYENQIFFDAVFALQKRNIPVVVHLILGLPNESESDILKTVDVINQLPVHGVKLQLLHVIEGTKLAELYKKGDYIPLELENYLEILSRCVARLRPDIIVHRFTGDGKADTLLAPLWSLKKIDVLNGFHKKIKKEGIEQGQTYKGTEEIQTK